MTTPGFTIPDISELGVTTVAPDQSMPDSVDTDILAGGYGLTGVVGDTCEVTTLGTMNVDVAAGIVVIDDVEVDVANQTPLVGNGSGGAGARTDLVVVDNTGAASVVAGTPSNEITEAPDVPADSVALAMIYVTPTEVTSIDSDEIVDKRIIVALPPTHPFAIDTSGPVEIPHPAPSFRSAGDQGTLTPVATDIYYEPFVVDRTIEVFEVSIDVAAASGAATVARIGFYESRDDWQPGDLVGTSADLLTDAIAVVSGAIGPLTLKPGNYLKAIQFEAAPTLEYVGDGLILGVDTTDYSLIVTNVFNLLGVFAALADPGIHWDVVVTGAPGGHQHTVMMKWRRPT